MIKQLLRKLRPRRVATPEREIADYLRQGRRPWSRGYLPYKDQYIRQQIHDQELLARFRTQQPLPPHYGEFLDERVVEYPWVLANLETKEGRLFDGGSILNLPHIIEHPHLANKKITIATLAPEGFCFWQKGVNYHFTDLRDLPFRDNYFDQVISISTLEHVGKDNTLIYTSDEKFRENNSQDFIRAVQELKRVCKPGGKVLISVPFGRFMDFGWYQQFDATRLDRLIEAFAPVRIQETFFRYAGGAWQFSNRQDCADCEGFDIHATRYMNPQSTRDYDPDFAAASRGIAALQMWKGENS